jgi:hypothetical protein
LEPLLSFFLLPWIFHPQSPELPHISLPFDSPIFVVLVQRHLTV